MRNGEFFNVTRYLFFVLTMSVIGLGSGCSESSPAQIPPDGTQKNQEVVNVRKDSMSNSKKAAAHPSKPGTRPIVKR
jgi:hypothetical protein